MMNNETVVAALNATTDPVTQREATELLHKQEFGARLRKASSSDNLAPLTDHEDLRKAVSVPKFDRNRIDKLMMRWRVAARRAKDEYVDPWKQFEIQNYPILRAKRYRYSSIRKHWTEDFIEVRLHPEPFARGAMRECYRLKKLSSMGGHSDWSQAQNYVAKKYMSDVDRRVLFEDVKLQMDAKLWAEEYNRYKPPKKIDIMQMCVIEVMDLPGCPLFHLEHFIEGEYLKYNSNSGFVSDVARMTPQAFSHFSFERSGHQMIIVDVQGVGDLYTDPQIHTIVGTDYGDGNLGTRGMALFFHSHECNDICHSLCLSQFDLAPLELEEITSSTSKSNCKPSTVYERDRHSSACVAIPDEGDAMEYLRRRTRTLSSRSKGSNPDHDEDCVCAACLAEVSADMNRTRSRTASSSESSSGDEDSSVDIIEHDRPRPRKVAFHDLKVIRPESRHDSMGSSVGTESVSGTSSRLTRETEMEEYWKVARKQSIPAGALSAIELCDLRAGSRVHQTSVLGQIHVDIARYHELGRFLESEGVDRRPALGSVCHDEDGETVPDVDYDKQSAVFHLNVARKCGSLEAVLTIAQIIYGLHHELLKDVNVEDLYEMKVASVNHKEETAFELMETAAEMGDKGAMLFVASAYETGRNLGSNGKPSFNKAIDWYQRVVGFQDEDEEQSFAAPMSRHEVLAKMAEMYKEGGYGLDQDFERAYTLFNEAADAAMESMNGKLANKYYEKAEMCSY